MDIIEKDFVVTGHKLGVFYAYKDVEPELHPKDRGDKVIPAPFFYERNGGNFTLWKHYEPGEKLGWPLGGYECIDSSGAHRCFDLDQVILEPTTPKLKHMIAQLRIKVDESAQTTDENGEIIPPVKVEYVEKVPGKRGRKPLSDEEKARREAELAERAIKSGGKRGRPKSDKPKEVVVKQSSGKGRGRPALSEEAKQLKEKEKADKRLLSNGKRGRPKKPVLR